MQNLNELRETLAFRKQTLARAIMTLGLSHPLTGKAFEAESRAAGALAEALEAKAAADYIATREAAARLSAAR